MTVSPPSHGPLLPADMVSETLLAQARSGDQRAIDKVAHGFESMFMSMLLKEMRQTLEPETMFPEDHGDVLGGMFDMFLSDHLAQAGAFGIAALVKQQLSKPQPAGNSS